ncbi:HTH_Tnp_Tc3_2 domain-containing protein [Trichonephila clavipes]|nr:HTH_Tnp_Tc3_2 domain-containing protein [Trichonephila clavipes]
MRWRIVGRLEAAQICWEFNLTPSVVCNLWKQFQDTGSIKTTGTRVLRVTVSKRLHERGLLARRHAAFVPLTSTDRRVRLVWYRQHRLEYGSMGNHSVHR